MPTEVSAKLRNWGLLPALPGEQVFLFGEQAEHISVCDPDNLVRDV
jgi:hypothetical protein